MLAHSRKLAFVALGRHISLGDLARIAAIKAKVAKVAFVTSCYMIDMCSPVLWVAAALCCLCLGVRNGLYTLIRSSLVASRLLPVILMSPLRVAPSSSMKLSLFFP